MSVAIVTELFLAGRLLVGAAAAAVAAIAGRVLGVDPSGALLLAVAASTVVIYDLDRILDRRSDGPHVPGAVRGTLAAALALLPVALAALPARCVFALLVGLPLCALYAIPLRALGGRRPKDRPVGKALFVAAAVTTATVALPLLEAGHVPSPRRLALAAGWVFAAILGNAIACDLRDRSRDAAAGLRTIPVLGGAERTRRGLQAAHAVGGAVTAVLAALGWVPVATVIPFAGATLVLSRSDAPRLAAWGLDGAFVVAGVWMLGGW